MCSGANRKQASNSAIHRDMGSCQSNYDMCVAEKMRQKAASRARNPAADPPADQIAFETSLQALWIS
jgi:hypothetical protein